MLTRTYGMTASSYVTVIRECVVSNAMQSLHFSGSMSENGLSHGLPDAVTCVSAKATSAIVQACAESQS